METGALLRTAPMTSHMLRVVTMPDAMALSMSADGAQKVSGFSSAMRCALPSRLVTSGVGMLALLHEKPFL